jgi:hypothetical protein
MDITLTLTMALTLSITFPAAGEYWNADAFATEDVGLS